MSLCNFFLVWAYSNCVFFPEITRESIKTKTLTREGIRSLLQAKGDEALLIVNILDEVFVYRSRLEPEINSLSGQILNESNLPTSQRQKCLAILRKLCGSRCLLPDSHNISDGLVVDTSSPVASGGYADVYKGVYKGLFVAVKVLRRCQIDEDDLNKIKKVRNASNREQYPPHV